MFRTKPMKKHTSIVRSLAGCGLLIGFSALAFADPSVKGVPNFHVVNKQLFRGGQPTDAGFRNLAAMGVKTIVDLQEEGDRSHDEKRIVKALGMHYVNVPMKGMTTPKEKQVSHALKALDDNSDGPVFIHCKRGADRTGVVIACYRIQHDRWDNQKALSEARSYGMSWYQFPLQRYVKDYEPRDSSGLDPAGIADSIREKSVDLAEKVSHGITGVLDRVRK
jgi:tyrosine-protein phosphatase SIW14